jgi:prepilin peptidase CpaA
MYFHLLVVVLLSILLLLCAFVSVSDFKYRKIPNQYLLIAVFATIGLFILAGMFLPAALLIKSFLLGVLGALMGGTFLYIPYQLKQVGAGDVKLVMVFGFLLGMKGVVLSILIGAMIGGIWALLLAYKFGGLSQMWHNMKFMARSVYLSGGKTMGWDLRSDGVITMPYGVALSLGASVVAVQQLNIHLTQVTSFL